MMECYGLWGTDEPDKQNVPAVILLSPCQNVTRLPI